MGGSERNPRDIERERRADAVLARALELPAAERDRLVDRECAGDEPLRDRVRRLLRLSAADAADLATGAALRGELAASAFGDDGAGDDAVGRRVGPFRLVSVLGRGGFATVYLGERADGTFDQQVAVKILHATDDVAAGVVARFEQERRILASLQHPHIAGLIDGGTTDWGRPFVVVEHVDGLPIDRYCDERRLTLGDRLRLVLDVADAVQHAHRRLIVHRDLKPSNILVTAAGHVKLLDFGIAKLLDPGDPLSDAPVTRTSAVWLTPRYASPEQLLGQPITTAADVYQLGVLLFELLVGRPAFDSVEVTPAALVEAASRRQSLRPSAAARGGTAPAARLDGDLDSIVLQATRPEPERRYGSAELFAGDVRNYLAGRPVLARGDSVGYRVGKFVGRNRLSVAVAGLLAFALAAFAIGITWGFVQAERERRRAEAVSAFLKQTLRGAQPHIALGRDTTLLEAIVDDAAARIDVELAGESYAAAEMRGTIAQTYRLVSRYDDAATYASASVEGYRALLGPDAHETLRAANLHGLILWDLGEFAEAELVLAETHERAERVLPAGDLVAIDLVANLGLAIRAQGRLEEAEPYYRQTLRRSRDAFGPEHERTISATSNLAFLLAELDRMDEAEALAREAADVSRRHLGPDRDDTWLHVDKLASLIGERGRPDEALPLHLEAYAGLQATLGPRHSTTLGSAYHLARVQRALGRHDDALRTIDEILPILREEFGADSRYVLFTLHERGRTLLAAGRPAEALADLERAGRLAGSILAPDHYQGALVGISLAEALIATGRPGRADPLLRDARRVLEAAFGADGSHRHFDDLRRVEALRF